MAVFCFGIRKSEYIKALLTLHSAPNLNAVFYEPFHNKIEILDIDFLLCYNPLGKSVFVDEVYMDGLPLKHEIELELLLWQIQKRRNKS